MADVVLTYGLPFLLVGSVVGLLAAGKLAGPWLRARKAGTPVSVKRLVVMSVRGVDIKAVVDAWLLAAAGDVPVELGDIESHGLARGRVRRAVLAAVAAKKANLDFSFRMAAAMDLAGRDVVEVVQDLIRARQDALRKEAEGADGRAVSSLVGASGEVSFAVGPPGLILVEGKRFQAVSDGGYISKGAPVRVIGAKGNMAVVQQAATK